MASRFVNLGQPVNRSAPLNRGLTAYWLAFTGAPTANHYRDLIGSAHGAFTNAPTWSPGFISQTLAVNFAASTAYVDVTGISLDLYTWAAWFYTPTQITSASTGRGVFRYGSDSTQSVFATGSVTATAADETVTLLAGVSGGGPFLRRYIKDNIAAGWTHITIRWTGSTYDIYLNGVAATMFTGSGGSITSLLTATQMSLGGNTAYSQHDGLLGDVRIYNRSLGADEIWQLYNASRTGYQSELNWIYRREYVKAAAGGGSTQPPRSMHQFRMRVA